MGLFDFLGPALGTNNTFHINPMQLDHTDYNSAIDQSNAAAIGSLNAGQTTGAQQGTLANQLQQQANGQGPSLAQMQLQQASDSNLKNNAALIASQRGINPAQAGRQVAVSNASQGQNLANQSAQLRLQEQLQKQQLLAQTLQGQRGLDINQQTANTGAASTFGGLQNSQNQTGLENYYGAANINAGVARGNQATNGQLIGGLIGAGGAMGASAIGSGGAAGGAGAGTGLTDVGAMAPMAAIAYSGGKTLKDTEVMVSPGEKVISPSGNMKTVPGKADFDGDDPRNDTVTADLREGSIVVPRSKSTNKENIIDFMKHMKQSSDKKSDMQTMLDSHEELKQKLEEINYKLGKMRIK